MGLRGSFLFKSVLDLFCSLVFSAHNTCGERVVGFYIFLYIFSHLHFSKRVNGIFSSLFTSRLSKTHSRRTLFVTRIYWLGQVLRLAFLLALAETSLNCSFVCEISILDNGTTFMFGQIIHLFGTEILYYCTIK